MPGAEDAHLPVAAQSRYRDGMDILAGECRAPARLRGGALALGNFDGVHQGHQAVIGAAIEKARMSGRPALVATFDPHPSRFFRPDAEPFALTRPEQKLALFAGLGLDAAVVIPFNAAIAGLSADAFAREWLADRLGVQHVVTGTDFTFGKGRSGNAAALARFGSALGFTSQAVEPVCEGAAAVSSTRIREALIDGDMGLAASLLTRPFTIEGEVIHGDKRGRTIGVPTANMALGPYLRPRFGVYAVRVRLPDGTFHSGVANIGIRPMFTPPKELLETWIFDWSGDLYGQTIGVELVRFLREERALDGLDALKAQIALDVEQARRALEGAV
jgi:riboflavin kinase/FMN adenylyltransferase